MKPPSLSRRPYTHNAYTQFVYVIYVLLIIIDVCSVSGHNAKKKIFNRGTFISKRQERLSVMCMVHGVSCIVRFLYCCCC